MVRICGQESKSFISQLILATATHLFVPKQQATVTIHQSERLCGINHHWKALVMGCAQSMADVVTKQRLNLLTPTCAGFV